MSDYHADSTIIEGIIRLGVKERILENTCREADLIRRRIIIGVHRLGCHQPQILIDQFTRFLPDGIF